MEKWSRTASIMMLFAFVFTMLAPMASNLAQAQDTTGPQIIDMSTGNPAIDSDYTILVKVVDDVGVSYVRLYIYFIIFGGITNPEYIIMDLAAAQQYKSIIPIPQNALTLRYSIYAYDTSNNPSISDVISRDVADDQAPIAVCQANVILEMGENYMFNGSASTDNVKISNFTWSFSYNERSVLLFGPYSNFSFKISGQYDGSLIVKDSWDNSNAMPFHISVADTEAPTADAGIELFVWAGNLTFLDGSFSKDNVGIVNYTWELISSDADVKLYGKSPSFTFITAGVYDVTLTVTDVAGNTDSDYLSVQVLNPPTEGSELPWWTYILIVMIIVIVIIAIVIIRI